MSFHLKVLKKIFIFGSRYFRFYSPRESSQLVVEFEMVLVVEFKVVLCPVTL